MSPTLKYYYRNFNKQKLIYSITIGGFAISLAVLVLIVSFILEEKSVDKHLPNIKNMYRIKQADGNTQIPNRIYQDILNAAPEIEKLCLIGANQTFYEYNNEKKWAKVICSNTEFIDIFSVDIILGEREGLLKSKTDVLITQSFAKKVFGDKNPLGQVLEFGNKEKKEVKAVIADALKTSSLKYDVIINLEQGLFFNSRGYNKENYFLFDAVMVINPTTNPSEIEKKIKSILKPFEGYTKTELTIQPFKNVYFDLTGENDRFSHANLNMIRLLSWIAIIILLLAIFNYINLTTAFNNERFKEICIRKTSGAYSKSIFYQFVKESYISCFIALILAIGIAIIISPLFKELFGREINILEAIKTPTIFVTIIIIFLLVGGLTGIIPAIIVSHFNPIELLQRNVRLKNSNIRGIYNTVQLIVTLSLIIFLIMITKQINYVKTKDVGFNKEYLLEVRLQGKAQNKSDIIKENLLMHPNIISVSASFGLPFGIFRSSSGSWKNDSIEYNLEDLAVITTDTSFLSTFGIKLIMGRNFRATDNNVCIINEKTYKHLQLDGIEGKTSFDKKIIGVVKDFHFKTMHKEIGFIELQYRPQEANNLNIRISGHNIRESLDLIKSEIKEFEPGMAFEPIFYEDWINTMYQKEEKQAKAIKIYSIIALILSCLGLLGLAKFSAIRRTKEIGVRKVNGAKINEVMFMLNKDFVKWVAIAFIVACPISWYAMHKWLENFAYKTTLNWWIFALAGILVMGIALLTVSWQTWRAARRNPVEALRYE